MKNKLLLILLLITTIAILSFIFFNNRSVFQNIEFNSSDYILYGFVSEGGDNEFQKEIMDFKIIDISTLKRIKNDWKFSTTSTMIACGHHYLFVLTKNDKCIKHFGINLNCDYLTDKDGFHNFESINLTTIKSHLIKLQRNEAENLHNKFIKDGCFD